MNCSRQLWTRNSQKHREQTHSLHHRHRLWGLAYPQPTVGPASDGIEYVPCVCDPGQDRCIRPSTCGSRRGGQPHGDDNRDTSVPCRTSCSGTVHLFSDKEDRSNPSSFARIPHMKILLAILRRLFRPSGQSKKCNKIATRMPLQSKNKLSQGWRTGSTPVRAATWFQVEISHFQ